VKTLGVQLHRFDQGFRRFVNLIIGYAEHRPADFLKRLLPLKIARRDFFQPMHGAVISMIRRSGSQVKSAK